MVRMTIGYECEVTGGVLTDGQRQAVERCVCANEMDGLDGTMPRINLAAKWAIMYPSVPLPNLSGASVTVRRVSEGME